MQQEKLQLLVVTSLLEEEKKLEREREVSDLEMNIGREVVLRGYDMKRHPVTFAGTFHHHLIGDSPTNNNQQIQNMPVYEGIGSLGSDKHCVVIEIGHAFTRCGFGNEFSPRAIVRSETRQGQKLAEIPEEKQIFNALKEFIEMLYFRYLAVNPKDRKVMVVESVLSTKIFRLTLAKVLFHHFEVPGLLFVPSHLMALVPLVVNSGIVVDVGYVECSVTPVIEGVTVLYASKFAPLGAQAVHERIKSELIQAKAELRDETGAHALKAEDSRLSERTIEDIKAKACVVPPFERGQTLIQFKLGEVKKEDAEKGSLIDLDYHLDGSSVLKIPRLVRELVGQVFFELCGNEDTIATMILDTIAECPIDARKTLAENVVVIGGSSMMPGFIHRLFHEVKKCIELIPKYKEVIHVDGIKVHRLPCKANYASWLGAAMFGSTDAMNVRAISRDQYNKSKGTQITDWSSWWPQK